MVVAIWLRWNYLHSHIFMDDVTYNHRAFIQVLDRDCRKCMLGGYDGWHYKEHVSFNGEVHSHVLLQIEYLCAQVILDLWESFSLVQVIWWGLRNVMQHLPSTSHMQNGGFVSHT